MNFGKSYEALVNDAAGEPCDALPLLAGGACADITPELPIKRGGGVGLRPAALVASAVAPLMAEAVAFGRSDQDTVIWVSMDFGSLETVATDYFRDAVSRRTGVSEDRILISTTHTHGGAGCPRFSLKPPGDAMAQSLSICLGMMDKGVEAAVAAYDNRRSAKVGSGSGRVERAAFNRRFILSNGRSSMGGGGGTRLCVEGPVDPELQTLWFEDQETGAIIAVLVNFAAHPSQMYSLLMLGPEYPGVMRDVVCKALGQDFPVLFLQGACGNVHTVDLEGDPTWGRGLEGIRVIGHLLAGEVIKQLHSYAAKETIGMPFGAVAETVQLAYRSFPADEEAAVFRLLEALTVSGDVDRYLAEQLPSLESRARAKAIGQREYLIRNGVPATVEAHAIRLGDAYIFTTSAHHFVEFQIALKQALPGRRVFWVDFTNGAHNYVPTRLAIALGGYETEHGRFDASAGETVLAAGKALAVEVGFCL